MNDLIHGLLLGGSVGIIVVGLAFSAWEVWKELCEFLSLDE